jgi:uroporphyrinogen-III synthase
VKIVLVSSLQPDPGIMEELEKNNIQYEYIKMIDISLSDNKSLKVNLKAISLPLIFTSKHAANYFIKLFDDTQINNFSNLCYAIKGKTSGLLKNAGFKFVNSCRDSKELSNLIISNKEKVVYHLTTNERISAIEKDLLNNGIQYFPEEVYSKRKVPCHVEIPYNALIFSSPSNVKSFLMSNIPSFDEVVFCIGKTTEQFLYNCGFKTIIKAPENTQTSLKDVILKYYCGNKQQPL